MAQNLTWVIKFSKLCNLRCAYCYEMPSLGDSTKIDLSSLSTFFTKIRDISATFGATPKICWHGGEPLLLPSDYIDKVFSLQEEIFGSDHPKNIVQTNLSFMSEKILSTIEKFDSVSISLDPFGDLRRDRKGHDSTGRVLENMATLTNRSIRFGAITVLNRQSLANVDQIFDFYNEINIGYRLLPFYRSADQDQVADYGLSQAEVRSAMLRTMDRWFAQSRGIRIQPIDSYVHQASKFVFPDFSRPWQYSKSDREVVMVVDVSGDLYAVADTYNPRYCYGNLLRDSANELLSSAGRALAINESALRMRQLCSNCAYLGSCSGYYVGEATPLERFNDLCGLECGVARNCITRAIEWLQTNRGDLVA